MFEYCCSHLNSGTVHHAPSMDDFLHQACPWVMGHRRFVEGYDRASNRMVCTSILCSHLLSSEDTYRKQFSPHLRRITTRPAVPDYKKLSQLPLNSAKRLVQHDPRVTIRYAACIRCGGILSRCIRSPKFDRTIARATYCIRVQQYISMGT